MVLLKSLVIGLAVATSALSSVLSAKRQADNNNEDIARVLDSLDESMHITLPNILTLLANGHADENTVASQFNDLQKVFTAASSGFLTIAPAAGSNTTSPTNDELSVEFGTVIQDVASGLSAITPARVSNAADLFASVDSIIAQSAKNFGITRPGGLTLVHTLMLDARQFLQAEGLTQTLTALGF